MGPADKALLGRRNTNNNNNGYIDLKNKGQATGAGIKNERFSFTWRHQDLLKRTVEHLPNLAEAGGRQQIKRMPVGRAVLFEHVVQSVTHGRVPGLRGLSLIDCEQ